ncbi:enoyl-CoA hydratase-related protein [Sphingobium sp.]|uniref:enoyl-CoA hydratase-related protein n=1 Tax=Sphingobium sp. TaxID=1912891 RepID=UPI0028BDE7B9|nr:enoyl-CoA hydratase-related protein [Sphingobium sp.]
MSQPVRIDIEGDVGIVSVHSPPVNALGTEVRAGMAQAFDPLLTNGDVRAIVLICEGRTFFAGADISEFGKPPQSPTLHEVMHLIENATKPVVAAIHGHALGGGLETALVCHYRIAVPSARLGLPEVHLGLLPGGGGTQRLPRIVGVEAALDLMVSGRSIAAPEAQALGLLDVLSGEERLRGDAVSFARAIISAGKPLSRIRDRDERIGQARAQPGLFEDFRKRHAAAMRGFKAPEHIVRAVEAAVALPFDAGLAREWELFRELEDSSESAAQRHVFFGERETAKIPGVRADTPVVPLRRAAIVGALEGAKRWTDILSRAGLEKIDVFDDWTAALANGADSLAASNIIIECASSGMALTTAIMQKLDTIRRPDSLLVPADIGALDRVATDDPSTLVGLSLPANPSTRLIEISQGRSTTPTALATALHLARKAGKVPVVSRAGKGIVSDRLARAYGQAVAALKEDGTADAAIHAALHMFGFPASGDGAESSVSIAAMEAIVTPILAAMANEGMQMLDEAIVLRPSDIDIAAVLALGWPVYRGGPMFWAEQAGTSAILNSLHVLEHRHGPAFTPAKGLRPLVKSDGQIVGN